MAGPLDIQRVPRGLVELLGMRASGDSPPQLAQQIIGSLELTDMFLADRMRLTSFSSGVALALGTSITSTGPGPGFMWLVYQISYVFPTAVAAAASIRTHLGIARQSIVTNIVNLPDMGSGLVPAGDTASCGVNFERPLVMVPGDNLGWRTTVVTGAPAVTPQGFIYYAEIGI